MSVSTVLDKIFKTEQDVSLSEMLEAAASHVEWWTKEETTNWIRHALQLDDLAQIIHSNSITGLDFRSLLMDREHLGLTKQHERVLHRALALKFAAQIPTPEIPMNLTMQQLSCHALQLIWDKAESETLPIHKYVIEVGLFSGSPSIII